MISYAQNFEDVLLARVFGSKGNGFYIDVGAYHPVFHSVTKYFYDLGWTGINIEPLTSAFELLQIQRPRDINLQMALGSEIGSRPFYNVGDLGLSTFVEEFAERAEKLGYDRTEELIATTTLRDVCDEYVHSEIDFLKIDVEGWERQVIEGGNWEKYRPRVVVVEAIEPNSQIQAFDSWEGLLLNANYLFAYFDGLNRFYVKKEDCHTKRFFDVPVNCFDRFRLYSQVQAEERLNQAEERLKKLTAEWRAELSGVEAALREQESQLDAVYRSRSWRVTAPLRRAATALRLMTFNQKAVCSRRREALPWAGVSAPFSSLGSASILNLPAGRTSTRPAV